MKTLIVLRDSNNGLTFNKRRICRDEAVKKYLNGIASSGKLIAGFISSSYLSEDVTYVENLEAEIAKNVSEDCYFFAETCITQSMFQNVDRFILITLQRVYPSTEKFELSFKSIYLTFVRSGSFQKETFRVNEYIVNSRDAVSKNSEV